MATLSLIALNSVAFTTQTADPVLGEWWSAPFAHANTAQFIVGMWFLWLFGDNVEARLGRTLFLLIYLACGWLGGFHAIGAITGVLGAYVALLPHSRLLMLVPVPPSLVEAPAAFFIALWCLLQALNVVRTPSRLWALAAVLFFGAAISRLARRPVTW